MHRRPRQPQATLAGRAIVLGGLIQGLGALAVMAWRLCPMLVQGSCEKEARMVSFADLVIANLGMILANRSRTRTIVEMLRVPNKADLRSCRVPVTFGSKLSLIGKRTMWITSWLTKQCNVLQAAAPAALIGSQ